MRDPRPSDGAFLHKTESVIDVVMENERHPRSAPDEFPHWTLDRMKLFIETLRRTCNVSAAARSVGMSRQAAYALRARLPGHPFDKAWAAAMAPREAFHRMTSGYAALQESTPSDRA